MDKEIIRLVRARIRRRIAPFPTGMSAAMSDCVGRVCFGAYQEEIPLLAARTFSALGADDAAKAAEIGAAHCLGWTAYRLFDLCADEKSGELAIAVALYRLMISEYRICLGKKGARCLADALAAMDAAQYAEEKLRDGKEKAARPPALSLLAQRSRGHALAVLAPIIALGYGETSAEYRLASDMMDALIVARQLSDDMRDWREDCDTGIVTRVNYPFFKKRRSGVEKGGVTKSMLDACADMLCQSDKAARLARMNPAFKDPLFFVRLAEKIARPARDFISAHAPRRRRKAAVIAGRPRPSRSS